MVTPQQICGSGPTQTASQGRAAHPDVTGPNLLGPRLEERAGDESGAPAQRDEDCGVDNGGSVLEKTLQTGTVHGRICCGATRQAIEPR